MSLKVSTKPNPDPNIVRQPEDLEKLDFAGTKLAVFGYPIAHSVSPQMHNAALNLMGQTHLPFLSWRYFKFEVRPERLAEVLPHFWENGVYGINLTIPHKVLAVDLVKKIDPAAAQMGAVNTLRRLPDGGYEGFNTDGYGLQEALRRDLKTEIRGQRVVILGAGGAARAAVVQSLLSGAAEVYVGNRSADRLQELLDAISGVPGADRVRAFGLDALPSFSGPVVLVNATSLGLKPEDPPPMDLGFLPGGSCVYDMTYGCENALQRQAQQFGFPYADGLSMLVWQGVKSLEIWTGTHVPAQAMMTAACQAKSIPLRHV